MTKKHLMLAAGLALALTACSPLGDSLNTLHSIFLAILRGGNPSAAIQRPDAKASPSRTLAPSEAAKLAKENSEILQEVLRVVYDREPGDRSEFGSLVDSMNQGASIEGLYNGFTHSSDYRKLEAENPGAKPGALSFFASELALTESELRDPEEFGPDSARPLALPSRLGEQANEQPNEQPNASAGVSEVSFGAQAPAAGGAAAAGGGGASAATVSSREASYLKTFSGASIYTLKRVLGDEMLRLVSEKGQDPKSLDAWYGAWVVRMCGTNVDFGLPLRNKADAAFHAKWAATADADRLKWEVLNRIHRILNARNDAAQTTAPSAHPAPSSMQQ